MIINTILVCYLVFLAILWAHYGLFSAFLHLVTTIVCAAVALALWEPIVLGVLINVWPHYAWGIGLLGPFITLLFAMRIGQDWLVKTNMRFENLTNTIGGGLCGLLSGILTSGLVIIGLGHLPIGQSMFDHQPMELHPNGEVVGDPGKGLALPVDRWTNQFFADLTQGAFWPMGATPLAHYRPNVARLAILNRQHPDRHASSVVHPGSVTIEEDGVTLWSTEDQQTLIEDPEDRTAPLLLVSTKWKAEQKKGTYDQDGGLRVAPSQVRLVSWSGTDADPSVRLYRPEGVVIPKSPTELLPTRFNRKNAVAYTKQRENAKLVWLFRVEPQQRPKFLLLRHLRIDLPPAADTARQEYGDYVRALFHKPEPEPEAQAQRREGRPTIEPLDGGPADHAGAIGDLIEWTKRLPEPISKHKMYEHVLRDNSIFIGEAEVQHHHYGRSKRTIVRNIYEASDEQTIRIHVRVERAKSLFGAIRQLAIEVGTFYLEDNNGQIHYAIGYVWLKHETRAQFIWIRRDASLRHINQLPLHEMKPKDDLYLYFAVPKETLITKLRVSNREQEITKVR